MKNQSYVVQFSQRFVPGFSLPGGLLWVVVGAALLAGCRKGPQAPSLTAPSVTVICPTQEPVTAALELTGTVAPSRSADLVARVAGYLESVNFHDGATVEEGQLLFVIEPESYKQQLALARAALMRAQSEYDRQLGLIKENATSAAQAERWLSERDQAAAQVELAKLNLGYTEVRAPFAGRLGRRLVDQGNLVGPNANSKLATLDQLAPAYVYFNLNERDALQLAAAVRQRGLVPGRGVGRAVFAGLQTQEGYPQEGTIDFLGSGFSTSSGTVQMRAIFTNQDWALIPGAFARVRIPLGPPEPMLVVPNSAIGNDQEGDYVLVVEASNLVARRGVVKGPQAPSGARAIRSGLTAEDRVIVSGLGKVRPGIAVNVGSTGERRADAGTPR